MFKYTYMIFLFVLLGFLNIGGLFLNYGSLSSLKLEHQEKALHAKKMTSIIDDFSIYDQSSTSLIFDYSFSVFDSQYAFNILIAGLETKVVPVFKTYQPLEDGKYNYHFAKKDKALDLSLHLVVVNLTNGSVMDQSEIDYTMNVFDSIEPTATIESEMLSDNQYSINATINNPTYQLDAFEVLINGEIAYEVLNSTEKEYQFNRTITILETKKIEINYQFYDDAFNLHSKTIDTTLTFQKVDPNSMSAAQKFEMILILVGILFIITFLSLLILVIKQPKRRL